MALVRNKQKIAPTLSFLSSPLSSVGSRNTGCSYLSSSSRRASSPQRRSSPRSSPLVALRPQDSLALGRFEAASQRPKFASEERERGWRSATAARASRLAAAKLATAHEGSGRRHDKSTNSCSATAFGDESTRRQLVSGEEQRTPRANRQLRLADCMMGGTDGDARQLRRWTPLTSAQRLGRRRSQPLQVAWLSLTGPVPWSPQDLGRHQGSRPWRCVA